MNTVSKDQRNQLRAPLPAEAIKPHPTKTYLSSIKPIFVTERLNDVFGIGGWQIRSEQIERAENGTVVVKTSMSIPEYDIYYESFGGNDNGGENSKNFDLGDAYKGAVTDSITKIASYMEIGIDVFKGAKNPPKQTTPSKTTVTPKTEKSPETPKPEKPWLNPATPNWEYAVGRFKATKGSASPVTIETIEQNFRLSAKNKTQLLEETK